VEAVAHIDGNGDLTFGSKSRLHEKIVSEESKEIKEDFG
jgi:hypothetical protein